MKIVLNAILFTCFLLTGCGRDPYAAYVGVWQSQEGPPKAFEISKNGDGYFMQDLRDYNMFGKLSAPMVLSQDGNQLVLKNGVGQVALGLIDNGGKLAFDRWTLTKAPQAEGAQIKTSIQAEFSNASAARSACDALKKAHDDQETAIYRSKDAGALKLERIKSLRAENAAKASAMGHCNLMLH